MLSFLFILLILLSIDSTKSSSIKSNYVRWKYNWDIHYLQIVDDNKPSLLLGTKYYLYQYPCFSR